MTRESAYSGARGQLGLRKGLPLGRTTIRNTVRAKPVEPAARKDSKGPLRLVIIVKPRQRHAQLEHHNKPEAVESGAVDTDEVVKRSWRAEDIKAAEDHSMAELRKNAHLGDYILGYRKAHGEPGILMVGFAKMVRLDGLRRAYGADELLL